jgi:hypothetical protein
MERVVDLSKQYASSTVGTYSFDSENAGTSKSASKPNVFPTLTLMSGVESEKLLYVVVIKRVYYPFFKRDSKNLSAS